MIWHLNMGAAGRLPNRRHDGVDWDPIFDEHHIKSGWSLGFGVAVIQFRGDWAEFYCNLLFVACFGYESGGSNSELLGSKSFNVLANH